MKYLTFFMLFVLVLLSCQSQPKQQNQQIKDYKTELKGWQDTMNREFSNPETSPLDSIDLINFKNLNFYPIDPEFCIEAEFVRTPNEKPFGMKTTTDRLPVYIKFGEALFEMKGKKCKLIIYQNQDLIKKPEYVNYLFIPFLDKTSGKTSYKGGRYLDLRIPNGNKIRIDFNKAYNPYCAYNHKFSCPIPPYENTINIAITAGVKAFK